MIDDTICRHDVMTATDDIILCLIDGKDLRGLMIQLDFFLRLTLTIPLNATAVLTVIDDVAERHLC